MKNNKLTEGKEELVRTLLLMKYDTSKTLTENKKKVTEQSDDWRFAWDDIEDDIDNEIEKSVQKILSGCSNRPEAEGSIDAASIASAFNRAFRYRWGTDNTLWRNQLTAMKTGNMDDLCNVKKEFEGLGYGDFAQQLVTELNDEELSELMQTFSQMNYRSVKASKISAYNTEQQDINYFKKTFICIFNSFSNIGHEVYTDTNQRAYMKIKGTSGKEYFMYADGSIFEGTKYIKRKIKCKNENTPEVISENFKKKVTEDIDDSSWAGGAGTSDKKRTSDEKGTPNKSNFTKCPGFPFKKYCISNEIQKVQECLGSNLVPDGKLGDKTEKALIANGYGLPLTKKAYDEIVAGCTSKKKEEESEPTSEYDLNSLNP
jgi:hypothetical protein